VQLHTPLCTVPCQQWRQQSRGSGGGGGSASVAEDRDTRCARSSVVRQTCWTQKLVVGGEKARHGVTPGSPYYYYYYKTVCARATKRHAGNKIFYRLFPSPTSASDFDSLDIRSRKAVTFRAAVAQRFFYFSFFSRRRRILGTNGPECPTRTPPTGRCGTHITLTPLQDRGGGATTRRASSVIIIYVRV